MGEWGGEVWVEGGTSPSLIGRQWLHSAAPCAGLRQGSSALPNCHLATDVLRRARAGPTMAALTSQRPLFSLILFFLQEVSLCTWSASETFGRGTMDLPGRGRALMTGVCAFRIEY